MRLLPRRFSRGAPAAADRRAREALRVRWDEHMGRLPPATSNHRELVELRARLAEYDAQASRYVGAVLMEHADGVQPPLDGMGDLALEMATLLEAHPGDQAELRFHIREFTEASQVVLETSRLQRAAAQPPA